MFFLGVSSNDAVSNSSILNGGIRARMRLHGTNKHATSSTFTGIPNVYQASTYNSGNDQASANKNNEQVEPVASNSLSNGHAISPADKPLVTLSGRYTVSLPDGRQISLIDHASGSSMVDGRVGTSAEQVPKMSTQESRNISLIDPSTVLPGIVGISRSDKLTVANVDICAHTRADQSTSGECTCLTEQSIAAPVSDNYISIRADQGATPAVDGCVVPRADQLRDAILTDNQENSQMEQSVVFTLPDGSHLEQSTAFLVPDARSMTRTDQSSILPMPETRRLTRTEQSTNPMATTRSNSRVVQRVASLTGQTAVIPSQSAQSGSSIVPGEVDPTNSEEPLPAGWEMRYDIYGRRLYYLKNNTSAF